MQKSKSGEREEGAWSDRAPFVGGSRRRKEVKRRRTRTHLLLSRILNASDHSVQLVSHGFGGDSSGGRFEVLQERKREVREVRLGVGKEEERERERKSVPWRSDLFDGRI